MEPVDARPLLERIEAGAAEISRAEAYAMLAFVAGRDVVFDPATLQAARRRTLLILAAGGDPRRELDPDSRGVSSFAADLDDGERRGELRSALERLRAAAAGLPTVGAALDELLADDELAWRTLASALLAEELAGADDE